MLQAREALQPADDQPAQAQLGLHLQGIDQGLGRVARAARGKQPELALGHRAHARGLVLQGHQQDRRRVVPHRAAAQVAPGDQGGGAHRRVVVAEGAVGPLHGRRARLHRRPGDQRRPAHPRVPVLAQRLVHGRKELLRVGLAQPARGRQPLEAPAEVAAHLRVLVLEAPGQRLAVDLDRQAAHQLGDAQAHLGLARGQAPLAEQELDGCGLAAGPELELRLVGDLGAAVLERVQRDLPGLGRAEPG